MSTQVTFKCDRCEKTETRGGPGRQAPRWLWTVGFVLERGLLGEYVTSHGQVRLHHSQHWCRDCLVEVGLLDPTIEEEEKIQKPPEPPTLESLIREIIGEIVEEKMEDR